MDQIIPVINEGLAPKDYLDRFLEENGWTREEYDEQLRGLLEDDLTVKNLEELQKLVVPLKYKVRHEISITDTEEGPAVAIVEYPVATAEIVEYRPSLEPMINIIIERSKAETKVMKWYRPSDEDRN